MIPSDEQLQDLYDDYLEFTSQMITEATAMSVAAIMLAQALSIYRTALNDEEYNMMMDSISDSRDQVKPFEGPVLQ